MSQVKLSLQDRTIPDKIQFARQIVTKMTGNAAYVSPDPALADITASALALETAYNKSVEARIAAVEATGIQNNAERSFDLKLTSLSNYVQNKSEGDATLILSAGMPVRDSSTAVGELPAPQNLSATDGDLDEEIDLAWNRVRGAASYLIQRSEDLVAWAGDKVSTKSLLTYPGCETGKKFWFRVAAVGAAGQGPWSDPATGTSV